MPMSNYVTSTSPDFGSDASGRSATPKPSTPRSAALLAIGGQQSQALGAVSRPSMVTRNKAITVGRMDELQDIFRSRHQDRCDELRSRLATLDAEIESLRAQLAKLEKEFQEATNERMAKDLGGPQESIKQAQQNQSHDDVFTLNELAEANEDDDDYRGSDGRSSTLSQQSESPSLLVKKVGMGSRQPSVNVQGGTPRGGSVGSAPQTPQAGGSTFKPPGAISLPSSPTMGSILCKGGASPVSPLGGANVRVTPVRGQSNQASFSSTCSVEDGGAEDVDSFRPGVEAETDVNGREILTPILSRRRKEQKYRETAAIQDSSIAHLRVQVQDVDRKSHKQAIWMTHIEKEILFAHIAKTRYVARLENAKLRIESLGEELSKAYENMKHFLDERMKVQDIALRNHALTKYVDDIVRQDRISARGFCENKEALLFLMERVRRSSDARSTFDSLMDQIKLKHEDTQNIVKHSERLRQIIEQIHVLWTKVPASLKEAIFYKVSKAKHANVMHPATAIQQIQFHTGQINSSQKSYANMLAEVLDVHSARRSSFMDETSYTNHRTAVTGSQLESTANSKKSRKSGDGGSSDSEDLSSADLSW